MVDPHPELWVVQPVPQVGHAGQVGCRWPHLLGGGWGLIHQVVPGRAEQKYVLVLKLLKLTNFTLNLVVEIVFALPCHKDRGILTQLLPEIKNLHV